MVGMADAERSEVDVDAGALRPGADATIDRSAMLYLAIRDRQVFPTARKSAKTKTPTLSVPLRVSSYGARVAKASVCTFRVEGLGFGHMEALSDQSPTNTSSRARRPPLVVARDG